MRRGGRSLRLVRPHLELKLYLAARRPHCWYAMAFTNTANRRGGRESIVAKQVFQSCHETCSEVPAVLHPGSISNHIVRQNSMTGFRTTSGSMNPRRPSRPIAYEQE